MLQSDRNNRLFDSLCQSGDGEVHHGKQTATQAYTVESRYLGKASHKPRQPRQVMALGPCVNYGLGLLLLCKRGQPVKKNVFNSLFYVRKNEEWQVWWGVFTCFGCTSNGTVTCFRTSGNNTTAALLYFIDSNLNLLKAFSVSLEKQERFLYLRHCEIWIVFTFFVRK